MKIVLITLSILLLPFSILAQVAVVLQLQGDAIYYKYDLAAFEVFENQSKIGNFNQHGYFQFDPGRKHAFTIRHPDFVELVLDSTNSITMVSTEISEQAKDSLKAIFQKQQLATCNQSQRADLDTIVPDTPAQFQGGTAYLSQYLGENINYPKYCIDKNIQGKVYISFIVEKTGYISCIKVEKSSHYFLDKEAFRCVKAFPKFSPAKFNGKPIATLYVLPITFRLN